MPAALGRTNAHLGRPFTLEGRMRKRVAGLAVVTATLLAVATPGSAQQQCGNLQWCGFSDSHSAAAGGSTIGQPTHSTCNVCPGSVFNCHAECGGTFGSLENAALRSAVAAAARGDIATVVHLGPLTSGRIRFNVDRRAVQILSCVGDEVIATLPITSPRILALAVGLPPVSRDIRFAVTAVDASPPQVGSTQ